MRGMKKAAMRVLKGLSITAVFAGAVLFTVPNTGCAARGTEVRAASENIGQPAGESKRLVVTKHGPRRR